MVMGIGLVTKGMIGKRGDTTVVTPTLPITVIISDSVEMGVTVLEPDKIETVVEDT